MNMHSEFERISGEEVRVYFRVATQ